MLQFKQIDNETFDAFFSVNRSKVFDNSITYNIVKTLSIDEKKTSNRLLKEFKTERINYFFTENQEIIGWSWGYYKDIDEFYMVNTGIFKAYQNQGIYSKFLKYFIENLRKENIQKITSTHHATNNQVIVPKLKAGFLITGLELNTRFGMMINLTYFFNKTQQKLINHRVGYETFDDIDEFVM